MFLFFPWSVSLLTGIVQLLFLSFSSSPASISQFFLFFYPAYFGSRAFPVFLFQFFSLCTVFSAPTWSSRRTPSRPYVHDPRVSRFATLWDHPLPLWDAMLLITDNARCVDSDMDTFQRLSWSESVFHFRIFSVILKHLKTIQTQNLCRYRIQPSSDIPRRSCLASKNSQPKIHLCIRFI